MDQGEKWKGRRSKKTEQNFPLDMGPATVNISFDAFTICTLTAYCTFCTECDLQGPYMVSGGLLEERGLRVPHVGTFL